MRDWLCDLREDYIDDPIGWVMAAAVLLLFVGLAGTRGCL
jgi:hypothetical protein